MLRARLYARCRQRGGTSPLKVNPEVITPRRREQVLRPSPRGQLWNVFFLKNVLQRTSLKRWRVSILTRVFLFLRDAFFLAFDFSSVFFHSAAGHEDRAHRKATMERIRFRFVIAIIFPNYSRYRLTLSYIIVGRWTAHRFLFFRRFVSLKLISATINHNDEIRAMNPGESTKFRVTIPSSSLSHLSLSLSLFSPLCSNFRIELIYRPTDAT